MRDGVRWFAVGKDAWGLRYGDRFDGEGTAGIALDEMHQRSWTKYAPDPALRAVNPYDMTQRSRATVFVSEPPPRTIQVTSWADYLQRAKAGKIEVGFDEGEGYFRGCLVRLRATPIATPPAHPRFVQMKLGDDLLDVHIWRALREEVDALGRDSETPGVLYDLWGYFLTPKKDDSPEKAHFEPILIVPAR